ncbi:MAG: hypothetical protein WAT25_20210 [Paracoccaceae bacterium]|nr:hypothetical protein [Rhodobacter sp.]
MIELQPPPEPPQPPAPVPAGWEGILQPGEQILWQDRPQPGIEWADIDYSRILFGLVFGGFALFWMVMAFWTSSGTLLGYVFPLFGLPFLRIGLRMVGEQLWLDQRRLRSTHYTLTDRAAFVASQIRGRRDLQRYPLTPGLSVTLDDGDIGNVWFAEQSSGFKPGRPTRTGNRRTDHTNSPPQKIGFERIARPREVWQQFGRAIAALSPPDAIP